jgi:hypothetical protein
MPKKGVIVTVPPIRRDGPSPIVFPLAGCRQDFVVDLCGDGSNSCIHGLQKHRTWESTSSLLFPSFSPFSSFLPLALHCVLCPFLSFFHLFLFSPRQRPVVPLVNDHDGQFHTNFLHLCRPRGLQPSGCQCRTLASPYSPCHPSCSPCWP